MKFIYKMSTKFTIELEHDEHDEHEEFLNTHHSNFPISYKHNFIHDMPKGFLMLTKIKISSKKSIDMNELLKSDIIIEREACDANISFNTIFYDCLLKNRKCKLVDNTLILKPKKRCINNILVMYYNRSDYSFDYGPDPCVSIMMCLPMILSIKMTFIVTEYFDKPEVAFCSGMISLKNACVQYVNPLFVTFSYFNDDTTVTPQINNITYTINYQYHYEGDNIIQKKFGDYVVCVMSVQTPYLVDDSTDIASFDDIYKNIKLLKSCVIKPCLLTDICIDVTPVDSIKYINMLMLRNLI